MSATPRLYITDALSKGAHISLADQQSHYVRNVMRLKDGARITVFNGHDGEWETSLSFPSKKQAVLQCERQQKPQRASLPVTVCFAPVKGGRVEGIIEKATELGATRIIPVYTSRTVAKHLNIERLSLIAREAAEQSERLDVPEISPLTPLASLLAEWPENTPYSMAMNLATAPRPALMVRRPPHGEPSLVQKGASQMKNLQCWRTVRLAAGSGLGHASCEQTLHALHYWPLPHNAGATGMKRRTLTHPPKRAP